MDRWIYMDNGATTPVDPRVLEAMLPFLTNRFGNAASHSHAYGWEAEEAVENARNQVARLIGANPREIIFTSGATESNNLACKGIFDHYRSKGRHVITSAIEHKAILDPCSVIEKEGGEVTILPVDRSGFLDPEAVRTAIRPETILVSVMHANNEIGTIQDIGGIGRICKDRQVILHADAAQSAGKIPLNVNDLGVDLLSVSAHKIYGPKGVGALFVRRRNPRVVLTPLIDGGGHERGIRSGTVNVPGIVGFGMACEIARLEMASDAGRVGVLRDALCRSIVSQLDEVLVNGDREPRLPGHLNMSFAYCEGESLLLGLNGLAVSTGSACTSASLEPSHVLKAIGVTEDLAHGSIRFTLGRFNTAPEIETAAAMVVATVRKLRSLSPLYEMMREGNPPASSAIE